MSGLISITLVGTLTDNPHLSVNSSGHSVASFTLALRPATRQSVSELLRPAEAVRVRCTVWRHLAEHAAATQARALGDCLVVCLTRIRE